MTRQLYACFFGCLTQAALLASVLYLVSCEREASHPEDYLFDFSGIVVKDIERVSCYQVSRRIWWSEKDLRDRSVTTKTVYKSDAANVWRAFTTKTSGNNDVMDKPYTNQDYLVVAEDSSGKKYALIIGQTFVGASRRILSCKTPGESWFASVEEPLVENLGIAADR